MNASRFLLIVALIVTSMVSARVGATAQIIETTYTSEMTGKVVDIGSSGEAKFDLDYTYTDESGDFYYEHIAIERGTSLIFIGFTNETTTPRQWEKESHAFSAPDYQLYEILDEQVLSESYSSIVRVTTSLQFTEIMFDEYQRSWIDGDPLILNVFATEAALIDDLHWTMDNVTVDGEPLTTNTDYSHLQSVLDGTSGVEPRIYTEHISTVSDWEEEGLVSENEWVSPQYGVTLTWDENWNVMFPKWNAVYSEVGGLDGVSLATAEFDGEVFVSLADPTPEGPTPQDWLDHWTSDEFLNPVGGAQSFTVLNSEISENSASVILLGTTWHGEEYIVVFDVYVPDVGTMIIRRTNATHDNIADIMTLTWDSVSADGKPIPHSWTLEEIDALKLD